eukprot:CAMPEP_0204823016 /NCGR_PEP_ID=MMETSP1346-20131115/1189_1 /ASSEMBLY_ACC=CAM_ASM_000771 /TAXON_ID=215587 /ORGANISM="Aplanochytrium stocchinoi, Strain GSBS06" /LENGTH=528 /DNA_ID=CAMNT_0051949539 /DNA_START=128 /DNA_END=1711 /DNA_ORIENTATION=+
MAPQKNFNLTRTFIYFCAITAVARFFLKLRAKLAEWNRLKKHLLKLPHLKSKERNKHQNWIQGDFNQMLPKDMPFTQDNVAKNSIEVTLRLLDDLDKEEGLMVKWYLNPELPLPPAGIIVLKDINLIRQLTSTKMMPKMVKGMAYDFSKPLIGEGILATSGSKWHKQRVIVEQGFLPPVMNKKFPEVVKTANELVDRLKVLASKNSEGKVRIDVAEEMLKTTIDVLGRVAFSYEFGSVTATTTADAPLYNSFDSILNNIAARVRNPLLQLARNVPFMKINIETNKALTHLNSTVASLIRDRKKMCKPNEDINDLLDVMLQYEDPTSNSKLTETEVVDDIKTLLFAGHDTTAAALTWAIYLMAKKPAIGRKIMEELETKWGGEITIENMERSEYLNACTLELLRLYPSAGFTKTITEDVELGKYFLPKGVQVLVLPILVQRNEEYYENANEYLPERWLKTERKERLGFQARLAKETLQKPLLPFSLGKRNCIGRPLALIEIRVVLLRLLQEFELRLPSKPHPQFQEFPW